MKVRLAGTAGGSFSFLQLTGGLRPGAGCTVWNCLVVSLSLGRGGGGFLTLSEGNFLPVIRRGWLVALLEGSLVAGPAGCLVEGDDFVVSRRQ